MVSLGVARFNAFLYMHEIMGFNNVFDVLYNPIYMYMCNTAIIAHHRKSDIISNYSIYFQKEQHWAIV